VVGFPLATHRHFVQLDEARKGLFTRLLGDTESEWRREAVDTP
jgi:hypothetical protein